MLFLPGRLAQHLEITIIEYRIRENNYGPSDKTLWIRGNRLKWTAKVERVRKGKEKLQGDTIVFVKMMLVIGLCS